MKDPGKKKFLFDLHNFDTDAQKAKPKEPPAPVFSLADMENARKEAYDKGRAEGRKDAEDGLLTRIEMLAQSAAHNLAQLEQAETERKIRFEQAVPVLVYHALARLAPRLAGHVREDNLRLFLDDFFSGSRKKSGFTLFVHPDMADAAKTHITEKMSVSVDIVADAGLPPAGARIEWNKGSALFDPDAMVVQLFDGLRAFFPESGEALDGMIKTPHNEKSPQDDTPKAEKD